MEPTRIRTTSNPPHISNQLTPAQPRIAIIDDDAIFLELMHDLLAVGEGYEVVTNSQWVRSFEFIKEHQPDLVILDLMMGRDQTGWAVLDLLRSDPATASIPVILCSAAVPALTRYAADEHAHPAVAPLAKPFDVDELLGTISRMLAPRAAA